MITNIRRAIEMSPEYVAKHRTKKCNGCKETLQIDKFGTKIANNRRYLRSECKPCYQARQDETPAGRAKIARREARKLQRVRLDRSKPENRSRFLLNDLSASDRKQGWICDLKREEIEMLISQPCSYCLLVGQKMTLDRIDNRLGHTRGNVNPACARCNYFRRNMPYEAWLLIVPGLREAIQRGLLDSWAFGPWSSIIQEKSIQ